ncbi:MAG: DNA recombination protein RmuC, partial [Candidatus Eisenbacteria bacterium]|nr:DNA recombination protein RmuC [Candidatus Eisenbacteria bacterium]
AQAVAFSENRRLLGGAQVALSGAFNALASDALQSNSESFLQLARATLERFAGEAKNDLEQRQKGIETLLAPVREALAKVDSQITEVEKSRKEAYGSLSAQLQSFLQVQQKLETQTGKLVTALRAPTVRGRWGEMQLRRVVEMAGMLPYCDFDEQVSVTTGEGKNLRPDLVVRLPGGRSIVVDAKTPLLAYLEATEAEGEEQRDARLKEHARQLRAHMARLSEKGYVAGFQPAPELIVMFLPAESVFLEALQHDPKLIEQGVSQRILPVSPVTLIALLLAVSRGWQEQRIAESAETIRDLGRELHDRLRKLADHLTAVGTNLDRAVRAYNEAVGSYESRVLVSARRFKELGVPALQEIPQVDPVERTARPCQEPLALPSIEDAVQSRD